MTTSVINWFWGLSYIKQSGQEQKLAQSESTAIDARVSVYPLGENHPLAVVFGAFDNEPLWDDWMAAINEYRQQEDERELQAEAGE